MKRYFLVAVMVCSVLLGHSQEVKQKLEAAVNALRSDNQMKHGILGFYVADANTGEVVYEWNSQTGLAPASTQKIITAAAAFELLGKDYKYKTEFGYSGDLKDEQLNGDIYFKGSGDPTLGSKRYGSTRADAVFSMFAAQLKSSRIKKDNRQCVSRCFKVLLPAFTRWLDMG